MWSSFRKAFFSGLILLAPLGITLFVITWLVEKVGGSFKKQVLFFVPKDLFERQNLEMLWNFAATFIVVALITALGFFSRYFIAKYLWMIGERILNNLPFVNTVYTSVKQIVDTFSSQNRAIFDQVVLVQFPREGCYAIGFLTGRTKGETQEITDPELYNIFVPTTPNPTSGFLVMMPRESIQFMDMTVGEGMKFIVSGGAVVPKWIKLPNDIAIDQPQA